MNTFHQAGVSSKSNATRGVPRIEELLSLTKEPKNPSVTIYLKSEDETNKAKAQQLMHVMEYTSLRDIVKEVSICFDPDDLNTLIEDDRELISQYKAFQELTEECAGIDEEEKEEEDPRSKWVVRFEFDKEEMLDMNITMDDVHYAFENGHKDKVDCVYSDFNADKLIFRIRLIDAFKKMNKNKGGEIEDQEDKIYLLNAMQDNMLDNTILKGVKGVSKVNMRMVKGYMKKESGTFSSNDIWVLDTMGSNLLDILGMSGIDTTRTYSNNIIEMYDVLGIEAARQAILNELNEVFTSYINAHHLGLLCDRMCATKKLVSIFRHGINNDHIGPIAKASFVL